MSDPVLTDDERDALLDGMSSGEVEILSKKGSSYASVESFEIGPRSRIVTNSFPRLQSLNRQFAGRMGKQAEVLLNAECELEFVQVERTTYSESAERTQKLALVAEYSLEPLNGTALIVLNAELIGILVETFFGGIGNDPAREDAEFFTRGETNVAALFCKALLQTLGDVWQPLQALTPDLQGTHLNTGIIDGIDGSDAVIVAEFDIKIRNEKQSVFFVWPVSTVAALIPVFEGQKRERNIAEDSRWAQAWRARVSDSVIDISSCVGQTSLSLGEVSRLTPGDIINIASPRRGVISARSVPLLEGRFGIHDGRHAIEATRWIEPDISSATTNHARQGA